MTADETIDTETPGSAAGAPADLVAIGQCCIDVYEDGVEFAGGNALNVAVAWQRAGHAAAFAGAVGDDDDGARLRAAAAATGVDLGALETRPGRTGVTRIALADAGERVLADERLGVSADYRFSPAAADLLAGARWVHGVTSPTPAELRAAVGPGPGLSYDFSTLHATDGLAGFDVVFYSWEREPDAAMAALLDAALAGGAKLAVALCGRHGSAARGAGVDMVRAAGKIDPVDTCGAGDAFIAAFVLARSGGAPVADAMAAAAAAAERACEIRGAFPQEPLGVAAR
ncbi:MAG: fructoselysine 6-kinase [Actinobacteria bacterium]|nr:fructoselysine 6-kinase [Actinomycetota bacterium]